MTVERYVIHWRSILTGVTGHGDVAFSKDKADDIVRAMNCNCILIFHWAEPVVRRGQLWQNQEKMEEPAREL